MGLIDKVLQFFKSLSPDSKVSFTQTSGIETIGPEVSEEQLSEDLNKLNAFENKIAQVEIEAANELQENPEVKKTPEYFDGLSIKNPFVGE